MAEADWEKQWLALICCRQHQYPGHFYSYSEVLENENMPSSTNDNRPFAALGGIAANSIMDSAVAQECRPSPPREMMPRPEGKAFGSMMPGVPGPQLLGADLFYLIENSRDIQKDLGLTKDQLARLDPASRNFRTKLQDLSDTKLGVTLEWARIEIENHVQARGA